MRAWRKAVIGVAVVVVGFVGFVETRPSTFHVERSITIAAPADRAYAKVNDFRSWSEWSPYEKLDPNMKREYGASTVGVGATYGWDGDKAGAGKMTIEKSEKSEAAANIGIRLDFTKPMTMTNTATFTFAKAADGSSGTKVTWAMDGEACFASKAMSIFFDMDKLVGADFEKGLTALKATTESGTNNTTATR